MISVILPVYNGQRFLREALDSVRSQTYSDFECICIDDGSSDDSQEIIRRVSEEDSRFRLIAQANQGVAVSLQRQKFVGQHCDTPGSEGLLQLRHVPEGPFVVAGDVIGGSDGGKTCGNGFCITGFGAAEPILQIAQIKDIFGLLFRNSGEQVCIFFTEISAVKIAENHDAAAVKAGGQIGKDRIKLLGLQGGVAPAEKQSCTKNYRKKNPQYPQGAALLSF